jgi:SP family general alpha glucoside:H+ symporter-like MFS transporter
MGSSDSLSWGMGGFLAAGVNKGLSTVDTYDTPWTWRVGYGLQWVWPALLIVVSYFAPESPWWLVRKGRIDDARKVLLRTASPGFWDSRNVDAYIAVIQHTNEIEMAESQGSRFRDMWRGTNLRRTEIQMGLWATQVWSGTAMTSLATVL